jgi:hypothetical protein
MRTTLSRYLTPSWLWLGPAAALAACVPLIAILGPARASGSEPEPGMLPNLIADPPDNAELALDSSTGPARLLLRFNGYVHNAGPGALDFRGSRAQPTVSGKTPAQVEEAVQAAKKAETSLSPALEAELAVPAMKVFQRVFASNGEYPKHEPEPGNEHREEYENYLNRTPRQDEPSEGKMLYVAADGHRHWHLQEVARYSLWDATKTAEVAPAQKVGFCLEDSQHVELEKGPQFRVYADNVAPFRQFCMQYRPNATSVYEGISPGWRDVYDRALALQWVDVSNVLPGEYWLREQIDPHGVIKQAGGGAKVAYATSATTVPGFSALAQSTAASAGEPLSITLSARAWHDTATPVYEVLSAPAHGTLGAVVENHVTYTPEPEYAGPDSFTFSAADPHSPFPTSPAIATVAIDGVAIEGAQASMIAGTSVQLSARASTGDTLQWSATAGTITSGGLYTAPAAPPAGGYVTVTARAASGAQDHRTIAIVPVPAVIPAPTLTPSVPPDAATPASPGVSRPQVVRLGRRLIMTTRPTVAGRLRLTAYLGKRKLGTCVTEIPAGRSFTCRVTLAANVTRHARIAVLATLRTASTLVQSLRAAAPVAEMKMSSSHPPAHASRASALQFWCGPSMGALLPSTPAGPTARRPSPTGRPPAASGPSS